MSILKRLTALGVSLCLFMPSIAVTAEDEAINIDEATKEEVLQEESYSLSLERAIEMALCDNPQILAADAKIRSSELSCEVINETQKDFNKMSKHVNVAVNISDGLETAYLKHEYYPFATKTALELAVLEKEQIIYKITYDVTQKYFNVKLLEKLVEIGKMSVSMAEDNAEVVNKNYELGYVSALEVSNVENAVLQTRFALEGYERNLGIAKEAFVLAIQKDDTDEEWVLTDDIEIPSLPENADVMIEEAMGTRYDVTALKKAFELQKGKFDIANMYVHDGTTLFNSAYSEYLNSKYTYENTEKLIKLGLKSEWGAILTAYNEITVAQNNLKIKEVKYESDVIKYEMGVVTNLEVTASQAELDGAKVSLEQAKMNYFLAVLKFGYNTYIGI